MRWRYEIIASLLCLTLLCSGCMGSREIDELSFILTVGVDKAEEPGQYIFTFRVAMPKSFAGEGGGENKDKTKLVSVKAPAISTAIRQLAVAMNRQPEMSHVSAIFVHEAVAKEGIHELVTLFLRGKAFRSTMLVLVTKDEVKTAMEKNTSPFELFQYRWVDSLRKTQRFAGSYAFSDIRQFYVNMAESPHAIITAYGSLVDQSLDKTAAAPLPKQVVPQYTAEDFPRAGGTELIVVGSAIFRDWQMIGTLNASEALGASILDKGIQTVFVIADPADEQQKVSLGIEVPRPEIAVRLEKGRMHVTVKVKVVCELADAPSNVDYMKGENRKKLEEQIAAAVKANIDAYFQTTQPLGADCIGVSRAYRAHVGTWQEWADIDWPDAYKNAKVDVDVVTSLKRSGLLWRYADGGEAM